MRYVGSRIGTPEIMPAEKDWASDLERVNSLPLIEAESELLKCCGSGKWAAQMVKQRPFANLDELLNKAERIWRSLEPTDWLEAFRSHPKIGEHKAAQQTSPQAQNWSEQEQQSVRNAGPEIGQALAELNCEYEEKFSYIFIVSATGKSSEEVLAILRERLNNDPERELRTAAAEQSRITQLRLKKLINQ
jgi:OHCU decarboxylase